jgi:putative ABC transport system permease protein
MWVPPELSDQLTTLVKRDLGGALGDDVEVSINRQDWATYGDDPFAVTRTVVTGIAVLVLLLGALGLVNIALVTVKQRVREIGIRRSFGATASRVFFAVMMESVVATVVAGGVGVIVSILVVQSPAVRDLVGQGMISDFPPFPADAAITGLVAATAVGALAGLLPALVAVRVKVIDAIRY